ncbi:hypothetical protein M422DRAFT_41732 [Sphaerobolus stellatus SS14]|nr:hypothetical protein M422DRAFT_41732 [Sphaerobolus stellatus SS14]
MSTLRGSPSPSPSPAPGSNNGGVTGKANSRASMGPQSRTGTGTAGNASNPSLALPSPRPGGHAGGGRPTSELLGTGTSASIFQSAEADAIDQWFENLQNYEVTLEEMAAASLDVNFKEELSAIEQWFRVLSEAERTAALYSLLQQSTQVQIRFFITVLQQMARSDPMTALLSPAAGGSMQAQMEAKLHSLGLKSPAIGGSFPTPASPSTHNFRRQSLAPESSTFLSPESAANTGNNEAAATLAQQRAKLQNKANAAHRISAPVLANSSVWAPSAGNTLSQVAEQETQSSGNSLAPPSAGGVRPKSMDLSSLSNLRSPRASSATVTSDTDGNDVTMSPMGGGNWASMVNTPAAPMFAQDTSRAQNNLDAATMKLYNSSSNNNSGNNNNFVLEDPKTFRRKSHGAPPKNPGDNGNNNNNNRSAGVYDNDGNLIQHGQTQPGLQQQQPQRGNNNNRNNNNPNNNNQGGFGWNGVRSPGLSGRFENDPMNNAAANYAALGLGSPGLMNMNMNMMGMPGFNMGMLANLNALAAAGLTPDAAAAAQAQLFAAQMAALSGQPGMMGGLGGFGGMGGGGYKSPGGRHQGGGGGSQRGGAGSDRRSARVAGGGDKPDEEVDPQLLEDVPGWLRSLRLHKYTPNFEGMTWRQMVALDEQELEAKGVAALGARRKMLKTFEQVRQKMGIPTPPGLVGVETGSP